MEPHSQGNERTNINSQMPCKSPVLEEQKSKFVLCNTIIDMIWAKPRRGTTFYISHNKETTHHLII